jgi:hypothetical protein
MSQIELPPYCGPCSQLDLIVVEIIFGRLFEAFRHISQATATGASTDDSTRPQKKTSAFIQESACAQVISNSFSFAISRPIGMLDRITVCRKTSKSESSKAVGQQLASKQTISFVAANPVPPSARGRLDDLLTH